MTFQEYANQNRLMAAKIKLRKYQLDLAKVSPAMGIWLGKQWLGQKDKLEEDSFNDAIQNMLKGITQMNSIISQPAPNRNIEDLE